MSRGNQRDVDRARAAARAAKTGKPAKDKDGLTATQRKERCVVVGRAGGGGHRRRPRHTDLGGRIRGLVGAGGRAEGAAAPGARLASNGAFRAGVAATARPPASGA